jgi:hypothetical protein
MDGAPGLSGQVEENRATATAKAAAGPSTALLTKCVSNFAQDDRVWVGLGWGWGGSLLWGDDAAYGETGGEGTGSAEMHGFGGHVGVFEAGAGVEEDYLVGGFEVA